MREATQTAHPPQGTAPFRHALIESYGTFLPPQKEKWSHTVAQLGPYAPARFNEGAIERRIARGLSSFELARRALAKCLQRSKYRPEEIDLIIGCNICKADAGGRAVSFEPSTAIRLRRAFGLKNALCFDINNACAGMLTGVAMADNLMRSGHLRRALIVSGEYISHIGETALGEINQPWDDRLACLTLADAGAALLLDSTTNPNHGFIDINIKTEGVHSRLCTARPSEEGGIIMHTDSRRLASVVIRSSVATMLEQLGAKNWRIGSGTAVIPHQTATKALDYIKQAIDRFGSVEKDAGDYLVRNFVRTGNTASTAHTLALARAISDRKIRSHQDVVFLVQASGATTGCALYRMDELPDRMNASKGFWRRMPKGSVIRPPGKTINQRQPIKLSAISLVERGSADTALERSVLAAHQCLARSLPGRKEKNRALLIHTGRYRDNYMEEPAAAALILGNLEQRSSLQNEYFAFDVLNGSSGWMNALWYAQSWLATHRKSHILITASEMNPPRQTGNTVVEIDETASACMLSLSDDGSGFSDPDFRIIDGSFEKYRAQAIDPGPCTKMDFQIDPEYDEFLSKLIESYFVERLAALRTKREDFSCFILPQRSKTFIERLARRLRLPPESCIVACRDKDLYSSSVPFALHKAQESAKIVKDKPAFILQAGSGIQLSSALYWF